MSKVILVNKNNKKKIGLEDVCSASKGLLHRAFSILIFNSKRGIFASKKSF